MVLRGHSRYADIRDRVLHTDGEHLRLSPMSDRISRQALPPVRDGALRREADREMSELRATGLLPSENRKVTEVYG